MLRETVNPSGSKKDNQRPECPVERTALVLCRAAAPQIFRDLTREARTFTELRATIVDEGGTSSRTLAARLKDLERGGFVFRKTFAVYPRRVEYSLTEKGRAMIPIIEAMASFGETWLDDTSCEGIS